ncbi:MAG: acyl-CoA dehydrogenase family protein [Anaerolineales bacterium]
MDFHLSEEQRLWRKAVHDFVSKEIKPLASEINEKEEIPRSVFQKMGPMGLLGMSVPEDYGGSDLDAISSAIAIEELAWGDGGTALTIEAHNELGCASVVLFGSEDQKSSFLPPVTTGEGKLTSLALTEPQAGSDLRNIQTKAQIKGEEWVIQGSKSWITNAGEADFIVTLVKTEPEAGSRGMSMIIVPTSAPGLSVAPPEKKMGAGGTHSHEVRYDNVKVPVENLLGEEGKGLQQTLTILDGGRISVGALSVGIAQAALEEGVAYAKERETFGKALTEHQAIQWLVADAAAEIHAARLMVYYAAWLKDQNKPFTKAGAVAKLYATEMAERAAYSAIQIHGAYGYSREYPVEAMYKAARLMTIGEGTSEIQRLVIARKVFEEGPLRIE